jgi:general secretion pathway protein K
MRRRRPSSNRPGFALVAALGLLVALASVGLSLSLQARARRLAALNVVEGSRAQAAATAGTEQARSRLTRRLQLTGTQAQAATDNPAALDPWRDLPSVLPETLALGESRFHVTLTDASASLNLNYADEDELRRLFVALRVDASVADRLAQAIMDWRDADDSPRGRGAERAQYERDGYDVLPANAPFRTVAELRGVYGMTDTLYAQVSRYLTVAGTGQVNLNSAPRPVVMALAGMTEEVLSVLQRARDADRPIRSLSELQLALTSSARAELQKAMLGLYARAAFDTHEVEVVSDGWTTGGQVHARVAGLAVRAGNKAFLVGRHGE